MIVGGLLCGCTNLSDKKVEQPFVISTIDLNEARFVKNLLKQDPKNAGNYDVQPGPTTTTVIFKVPPKPVDEAALRDSMKKIKNVLTQQRGRTANTLRFVFPEVTLEE